MSVRHNQEFTYCNEVFYSLYSPLSRVIIDILASCMVCTNATKENTKLRKDNIQLIHNRNVLKSANLEMKYSKNIWAFLKQTKWQKLFRQSCLVQDLGWVLCFSSDRTLWYFVGCILSTYLRAYIIKFSKLSESNPRTEIQGRRGGHGPLNNFQ